MDVIVVDTQTGATTNLFPYRTHSRLLAVWGGPSARSRPPGGSAALRPGTPIAMKTVVQPHA
jgi:hypothetical protein